MFFILAHIVNINASYLMKNIFPIGYENLHRHPAVTLVTANLASELSDNPTTGTVLVSAYSHGLSTL